MATKTANLYARIEPQIKVSAESILEALGIPVSTAINMFYIQIILNNGLPFNATLPGKLPVSLSNLSDEQFNLEIEKGYKSMIDGKGRSAKDVFSSILGDNL